MHLECVFASSSSMSRDLGEVEGEEGFLLLSSKQLVDEELCWQFGPTSSLACSSQYIIVEKDATLQFTAETRRKRRDCGRQADIERERQWIGHEDGFSECGLFCCLYCKQKKSNDSSKALCDGAGGETRSTESRSARLYSAEGFAVEGFNEQHAHGRTPLCSTVSANNQQDTEWPLSSHGTALTGNLSEDDQQQPRVVQLSSWFSSNSVGDQVFLSQRFQSAPQPLVVSLNLQNQHNKRPQKSFEDRGISWSKDTKRGNAIAKPERLGAALCLSQTRARNAETLAFEVLIEKEKLAKLFFREANTCRMYKKKLQLLELENLWLKTNVENTSEMRSELPSYFNTSASRHCKFYKRGFSKDSSLAPGTIGLAFALGLSCASAGFVLGCCMGLIGLSH